VTVFLFKLQRTLLTLNKEESNGTDQDSWVGYCEVGFPASGKPEKIDNFTRRLVQLTGCRFHGAGGGALKGERNGAYRHGLYTQEAVAERRYINELLRQAWAAL